MSNPVEEMQESLRNLPADVVAALAAADAPPKLRGADDAPERRPMLPAAAPPDDAPFRPPPLPQAAPESPAASGTPRPAFAAPDASGEPFRPPPLPVPPVATWVPGSRQPYDDLRPAQPAREQGRPAFGGGGFPVGQAPRGDDGFDVELAGPPQSDDERYDREWNFSKLGPDKEEDGGPDAPARPDAGEVGPLLERIADAVEELVAQGVNRERESHREEYRGPEPQEPAWRFDMTGSARHKRPSSSPSIDDERFDRPGKERP